MSAVHRDFETLKRSGGGLERYRALLAAASSHDQYEALFDEHFSPRRDAHYDKQLFAFEATLLFLERGDELPDCFYQAAKLCVRRPTFPLAHGQAMYNCLEALPAARSRALRKGLLEGCLRIAASDLQEACSISSGLLQQQLQELLLAALHQHPQRSCVPLSKSLGEVHRCILLFLLAQWDPQLPKLPEEYGEAAHAHLNQRLGQELAPIVRAELEHNAAETSLEKKLCHALSWLLRTFPLEARARWMVELPEPAWWAFVHSTTEEVVHYALSWCMENPEKQTSIHHKLHRHELPLELWADGARQRVRDCEDPFVRRELLKCIAEDGSFSQRFPVPTKEALPELLGLIDLPDELFRLYLFRTLNQLPFERALPVVESAYASAPLEGRVTLLRQYARWAWLEDREELLDGLEAQAEDPQELAAIATARARAHPHWPELLALRGPLQRAFSQDDLDGLLLFPDDSLRQRELEAVFAALLDARRGWIAHGNLEGLSYDPLLAFYAMLCALGEIWSHNALYLFDVQLQFPDAFFEMAVGLLRSDQELRNSQELYRFATEHYSLPPELHLHRIRTQTGKLQKYAYQQLAECKEEALPACEELLGESKASLRMAGIRALHLTALPEAVELLEAALQKERSAKCKQALQEAIEHCSAQRQEWKLGIYLRPGTLEEPEGLEQLRELLSRDATPESWVRCCDILQRLEHTPSQELGIDYLKGHDLSRWPDEDRLLPWTWSRPELLELGTPEGWWAPVSTFFASQHQEFVEEALVQLEKRQQKRKLPVHLIEGFLDWIEVAWRWCEQNQIPLEWLEARLDGGCFRGTGRPGGATHLSLWRNFGLRLERETAYSGYTGKADIRWIRIQLPPGHPYRELHPLRGGNRYIELRDLFSDLDQAREQLGLSTRERALGL